MIASCCRELHAAQKANQPGNCKKTVTSLPKATKGRKTRRVNDADSVTMHTHASSQVHVFKTRKQYRYFDSYVCVGVKKPYIKEALCHIPPKASCMCISSGIITSVESSWSNKYVAVRSQISFCRTKVSPP